MPGQLTRPRLSLRVVRQIPMLLHQDALDLILSYPLLENLWADPKQKTLHPKCSRHHWPLPCPLSPSPCHLPTTSTSSMRPLPLPPLSCHHCSSQPCLHSLSLSLSQCAIGSMTTIVTWIKGRREICDREPRSMIPYDLDLTTAFPKVPSMRDGRERGSCK